MPSPYFAMIYRYEPETRWFHRHVLRRRDRRVVFFAGPLDTFEVEQELNQITNAVFAFRDPSLDLPAISTAATDPPLARFLAEKFSYRHLVLIRRANGIVFWTLAAVFLWLLLR